MLGFSTTYNGSLADEVNSCPERLQDVPDT